MLHVGVGFFFSPLKGVLSLVRRTGWQAVMAGCRAGCGLPSFRMKTQKHEESGRFHRNGLQMQGLRLSAFSDSQGSPNAMECLVQWDGKAGEGMLHHKELPAVQGRRPAAVCCRCLSEAEWKSDSFFTDLKVFYILQMKIPCSLTEETYQEWG